MVQWAYHERRAGGAPHYALVEGLVSQAFGEPATLFKDKINYKGPGGGSFLDLVVPALADGYGSDPFPEWSTDDSEEEERPRARRRRGRVCVCRAIGARRCRARAARPS